MKTNIDELAFFKVLPLFLIFKIMKRLIVFITFLIFSIVVSAQSKSPSTQDQLSYTQEQLNANFTKAQNQKVIGTLIALVGGGIFVAGIVKLSNLDKEYGSVDPPLEKQYKYMLMSAGGAGLSVAGLVVHRIGKVKGKEIKAELVKFQGSAMVYGVGLKIRF